MPESPVDAARLWRRVEALAALTDRDRPYTRRSFSAEFVAGRRWLGNELAAAGLEVSVDAGGNLAGRRRGRRADALPIVIGSHTDTVRGGGRFDGIAGVVAALEVARSLAEHGVTLDHPLEVVDFLGEEPSEFGVSCIGSRAVAGALSPAMLAATGPTGETLAQAIARMGGDPERLRAPLRPPGSVAAYLELHIEQGPVLETRGLAIGIVTDIVGIRRIEVAVSGRPDHAGTTPLALRRDALVGAAEVIRRVHEKAALAAAGPEYLVATVGRVTVEPNTSNVVPGLVELTLEVRSVRDEAMRRFLAELLADAGTALGASGLTLQHREVSSSPPTRCAASLRDVVSEVCRKADLRHADMPSGAGHDAVYMAKVAPVGMIFIPCREGRSHCPEEWTQPAQLAAGAAVLYETVRITDTRTT